MFVVHVGDFDFAFHYLVNACRCAISHCNAEWDTLAYLTCHGCIFWLDEAALSSRVNECCGKLIAHSNCDIRSKAVLLYCEYCCAIFFSELTKYQSFKISKLRVKHGCAKKSQNEKHVYVVN